MLKMDKYYFYNGFAEPRLIDISDLEVESNYLGDITEEVLEEYENWKDESDVDFNEQMGYYGIYRNPTRKMFEELNINVFGLSKGDWLANFKE